MLKLVKVPDQFTDRFAIIKNDDIIAFITQEIYGNWWKLSDDNDEEISSHPNLELAVTHAELEFNSE